MNGIELVNGFFFFFSFTVGEDGSFQAEANEDWKRLAGVYCRSAHGDVVVRNQGR